MLILTMLGVPSCHEGIRGLKPAQACCSPQNCFASCLVCVLCCPGFGQDRINFHQNPGRGTAGWADPTPTWPNRAGYSIPCAVMLGSGGGGQRSGNSLTARERGRRSCLGERLCGSCGSCRVFSLSVSLLFLFPFVCSSVKLPLSRPTSFCLFLFILLRTPAGGGVAAWHFCCRRQPKPEHLIWRPSVGRGFC